VARQREDFPGLLLKISVLWTFYEKEIIAARF